MRLAYQAPYDWAAMLGFFAARAITGLETVVAGVYRRSISVGGRHYRALATGPRSTSRMRLRREISRWRPLRAYAAQHLWTSLQRVD
ncbi:hypothetical protein LRS56_01635 [Pseudomonas poae]|nr:hypothetical protein LRS56_01635 [Pseudomonas poae]